MPYPTLTDHRMPYDIDGTLVYHGTSTTGAATALSSAQINEANDEGYETGIPLAADTSMFWFFFPEQREVTGFYARVNANNTGTYSAFQGSNDSTNGQDGTWETASLPNGYPTTANDFSWRSDIKPVSFTGPKKNVRFTVATSGGGKNLGAIQLYGEAAAGQMAHDLIFINHDDTPGAEFTASEDFGDQPLGTTVVRQFRVKNTSATRTATNINLQCNDTDFALASSAGGPWVATLNIASLAPGAESATLYVRCTTPAPGAPLLPRFSRITMIADAGFFG